MISDDTQQAQKLNHDTLREFVDRKWNDEIVPALTDYIAVPAKSPAFDADWEKHGFIERVTTEAAKEIAGKRSLYAPTSSFLPSSMQWKLPQKAFD